VKSYPTVTWIIWILSYRWSRSHRRPKDYSEKKLRKHDFLHTRRAKPLSRSCLKYTWSHDMARHSWDREFQSPRVNKTIQVFLRVTVPYSCNHDHDERKERASTPWCIRSSRFEQPMSNCGNTRLIRGEISSMLLIFMNHVTSGDDDHDADGRSLANSICSKADVSKIACERWELDLGHREHGRRLEPRLTTLSALSSCCAGMPLISHSHRANASNASFKLSSPALLYPRNSQASRAIGDTYVA
jgi:hypothetical protein